MNNGSHGIGLSVCKRFAKQLNGDLSLTESYTDGCEFVFKLVVKVVRDYRQVDSQIQRVKIKKKRTDRATIPGPNVDMSKIYEAQIEEEAHSSASASSLRQMDLSRNS